MVKIIKSYADKDIAFRGIEHGEKSRVIAVGVDIDYVFGAKPGRGYVEYPAGIKILDDIKSFVKSTKRLFILKGNLNEALNTDDITSTKESLYLENSST